MLQNFYIKLGGIMLLLLLVVTFVFPFFPSIQEGLEGGRVTFLEDGGLTTAPYPPSPEFPLGSDRDGRSLISVLVVGAKDTLLIITLITVIRYAVGIILGVMASFGIRMVNSLLDTFDQMFSSLPVVFFAVLLLNLPFLLFMDNRFIVVIIIIALIEVGRVGVTIKDQILSIKKEPYIDAAITVGVSPLIMTKNYYIPNLLPTLIINFCYDLGRIALIVGQLGVFSIFVTQEFVQVDAGYGKIENNSLNWATLLGQAKKDIYTSYWIPLTAAMAILYLILTFNILGEGLRRVFERKGV
ncbi:ABC transporter permease subunit [Sutcliffiella rhizosphaerae]|uniref:D,D-dipeptide transport system permease protein DdpC n=1 Tax=Sutcliffiella rhizosphaerae TaxID=2880967 RepID=A0ABM8YQW2_9BACI|nr:ABC transporter permease subunit [Sutcliffiella rhizosphaerae]CAG9622322.1 putative D,D-dipeptide transport system permease protein DdpC [Sutcliffiella rhizosphaerae]